MGAPARVAALATALVFVVAAPAAARDYSGTALNVIPSGQWGGVPVPAGADTQAKMYDALTPLFDQVTPAALTQDFKREQFGIEGQCPCHVESTPRKGLRIVRDRLNVPHITGKTRDDVTWGAGWVLQEDRGLLLQQGRYAGRFAALDVPGINAFSLVTGLKQVTVTKQADRIIDREQTGALKHAGREGRRLLHDIDVYLRGHQRPAAGRALHQRASTRGSTSTPPTRWPARSSARAEATRCAARCSSAAWSAGWARRRASRSGTTSPSIWTPTPRPR